MNWLLLVADVLDAVEHVLRQYAVSETVQVQEPAQLTLEVTPRRDEDSSLGK
jgi:hypothetical protein